MKKMYVIFILAVFMFQLSAAEGHWLKYDMKPGEILKYSSYYRSVSTLNALGKETTYDNLTKLNNKVTVVSKKQDGFMLESLITSAEATNNGKPVNVDAYVNKKENYYFLSKGVYYKQIGDKFDPNPQVQLLLPEEPVGVGSTWEVTRDLDFNVQIPELKKYTMKFEYKFTGIEYKNGYKCAVIRIVGKGKQPVIGKINGTFDLVGETYFSLKSGRIIESKSKMEYDVKVYESEKSAKLSLSMQGKELRKVSLEK